ncbi:MAG: tRNA glutamyl-Q(34) synthetase GluQRS [Gammaproteobacteria bacterium]
MGTNGTRYTGRFAPSPTGPLHAGSLFTALASFLDARNHDGRWLVRIDDIDEPRNVAGASNEILRTLENFGLHWDGEVYFQSRQLERYRDRLEFLKQVKLIYPCTCSRKTLAYSRTNKNRPDYYPGYCKTQTFPQNAAHAVRIRVDNETVGFEDFLHGRISEKPSERFGDFIIQRKDRIFSYQFTVVLDDDAQQVTHIVRGSDLLDSTARQLYLQRQMGLPPPVYMHVPLIVDRNGDKLSKQTLAKAVDRNHPRHVIYKMLELLRQAPPPELADCSLTEILDWGIRHWRPETLIDVNTVYSTDV